MSFRPAKDHTLIAQLVGRMVRSPLARRVEADERLNSVDLFLPHYDAEGLKKIVAHLADPDPESQMPITPEIGGEGQDYPRADNKDECFEVVEGLPSYEINRAKKQPEAKRLLRLGFLLSVRDSLDKNAQQEAEEALLDSLRESRKELREDGDFVQAIQDAGEIKLRQVDYTVGTTEVGEAKTITVPVTPENINDLFKQLGRGLAPGEGLHKKYWRQESSGSDTQRPKIELICLAQRDEVRSSLEEDAKETFTRIWERNKARIAELPEGKREAYQQVQGVAAEPSTFPITLPDTIHVKTGDKQVPEHLYQDDDGDFSFEMNTWEEAALGAILQQKSTAGWLRNQSRKSWALCIPYEDRGTIRGFYPDFIVLRKIEDRILPDVVEPHDLSRDDSWKKAKGLADYSEEHGIAFGRLLIGIKEGDNLQVVDVNDRQIRDRAKRLSSNDELKNLIQDEGGPLS